ncbi:MAG TPA: hypothetical protein PLP06_01125 [Saprospiraceae bacterium]|nr:hypothetical protein [Saprospiraceae bacterium]
MSKYIKFCSVIAGLIFSVSCNKGDELVGPFKDKLPVIFRYRAIHNITPTYVYTDGIATPYAVSNRDKELDDLIKNAEKQVNYIKILSADRAQFNGAVRDGTPISLDSRYSQSGKTYTFESDYLIGHITYTSTRSNDTMSMRGLVDVTYRSGQRINYNNTVQIEGFKLSDDIAKLQVGDTLYYRELDVLLIKE